MTAANGKGRGGGNAPDPVLEAARELAVAEAEYEAAADAHDEGRGSEEAAEAAAARYFETRFRLAETSATTLEGLAVKVRLLADQMDDGRLDGNHDYPTVLGRGICADMVT